jgi:hypothetical protein
VVICIEVPEVISPAMYSAEFSAMAGYHSGGSTFAAELTSWLEPDQPPFGIYIFDSEPNGPVAAAGGLPSVNLLPGNGGVLNR